MQPRGVRACVALFVAGIATVYAVTSTPGVALQGPNVYAGLYIPWPGDARKEAKDYIAANTMGVPGSLNLFQPKPLPGGAPVIDTDLQIVWEILNWLQSEVYNVNCGMTVSNPIENTWLGGETNLWPFGWSGQRVYTKSSTQSCGTEGGKYVPSTTEGIGPAGQLLPSRANILVTPSYIWLPFQVFAEPEATPGYKIKRTLCMSVNDISRLTTWGAARYGWTSVANGGGVQFVCDPGTIPALGTKTWPGIPNAVNCKCGDQWLDIAPASSESTLGSFGLYVTIALVVLLVLSVLFNCYLGRGGGGGGRHLMRQNAFRRRPQRNPDDAYESVPEEEEAGGGEDRGGVKLRVKMNM